MNKQTQFSMGALLLIVIAIVVVIYNEQKTKEINTSLIAGVTITYFFIVLLPEINTGLADFPNPIYKFIGNIVLY